MQRGREARQFAKEAIKIHESTGDTNSNAYQRLVDLLDTKTSVELDDQPLSDALDWLGEQYRLPIRFAPGLLDESQNRLADAHVALKLRNVSGMQKPARCGESR